MIGFFDSGIGGLSILREFIVLSPKTSTIYFADPEYFPYGELKPSILRRRAQEITEFLISKGAKVIVVACNSASVSTLTSLRRKFKIPIVGVVPVVKSASVLSKTGKVIILATPVTARSAYSRSLVEKHSKGAKVQLVACEDLAEAVEHGTAGQSSISRILTSCLPQNVLRDVDVIGLSCTHFPLVAESVKKFAGPKIKIIDSGLAVARQIKRVMHQSRGATSGDRVEHLFYTSGDPIKLRTAIQKYLDKKPLDMGKVSIYTDRVI